MGKKVLIEECLLINEEEIMEFKNHHSATTTVEADSSGSQPWMLVWGESDGSRMLL